MAIGWRPCVHPVLVALSLLAGCITTHSPADAIGFHIGDWASYTFADGRAATIEVLLAGQVTVRDGNRQVQAYIVDRWVNDSASPIPVFHLADAVDVDSGRLLWSTMCPSHLLTDCEDNSTFYFGIRGTPGMWGAVAARENGSWPESGCGAFEVQDGGINGLRILGLFPLYLPEGGRAEFCDDAAFPRTVEIAEVDPAQPRTILNRAMFRVGSGPEVSFDGSRPLPGLENLDGVPWNGKHPGGPAHERDDFPVAEAWRWLTENDSTFKAFSASHPQNYLAQYETLGASESRTPGLPVIGDTRVDSVSRRTIDIASTDSRVLRQTLEKTCLAEGPCQIRVESTREEQKAPTLDLAQVSPLMIPSKDATTIGLGKLGGEWVGTDILTEWYEPSVSYYAYRVKVLPASSATSDPGFRVSALQLALIRGDTGETFYAVGPRALGWID